MINYSKKKILRRFVVLTVMLFVALVSETSSGNTHSYNNLTLNYLKKYNNSDGNTIPSNEIKTNLNPGEIICPYDISTYTDLNSCTSYISDVLNVQYPKNSLTRLTWEMTGATVAHSASTGINQIDEYEFNEGVTTVTYTIEDQSGNITKCSFTVTITDNQVPRLEDMPGDTTIKTTPGECSAPVSWRKPAAGDNCTPASEIIIEGSNYPGSIFPVGKTTVYYHAYDAMNNQSARQSFTITVEDREYPQLLLPEETSIKCGSEVPLPWHTLEQFFAGGGFATDNCEIDTNSFRFLSETSDAKSCPLTFTRTYEISDINGNKTTAKYLIHVAAPEKGTPILKSGMADYTATQDGPWNDPATWGGSGPPAATDNVTIPTGIKVTADNVIIDASLTLEDGAALEVSGNWTNNGTFTAGTNSKVTFMGTSAATIGGTATTIFKNFIIDKGAATNILQVNSDIDLDGDITFTSGLMQINSGAEVTCTNNSGFTIESDAGLFINGGSFTTGPFSVENKGLFRIDNGSASFGSNAGNGIIVRNSGAFEINGGTIDVAGRLEVSGGTANISGGIINLNTVGQNSSSVATLDLSLSSNVSMTAGTINLININGSGFFDVLIENGVGGSKNFSGGVMNFGSGSSETYRISSDVDFPAITAEANVDLEIRRLVSSTGTYKFPLTDGSGKTIPVTIELTGGNVGTDAWIQVATTNSKHSNNASSNNYLNRYWTITSNGISNPNYDITVEYTSSDISGTESEIAAGLWTGSLPWEKDGAANTSANTFTFSGITVLPAEITGITLAPPTVEINNGNGSETICNSSSITLAATVTGDLNFSYLWTSNPTGISESTTNITVTPTINTTYTVTVTDGNGFTASDDIKITVDPVSAGGTALTDQTICNGDTPADITLSGYTGNIQWQSSPDNSSWSSISGATGVTLTSAQMGTLTATSYFRAQVTSGTCTPDNSNSVTITVDPTSMAGTASADQTICNGDTPGNITLSGFTGNIQWQSSSDNSTWSNINGATNATLTSMQVGALTATTYFRAQVTSGTCPPANSNSVSVIVDPVSVGGTITGETTVCSETNSTTLTLSGYVGAIQKWEATTDGTTWTDIANPSDTYVATDLTQTTTYRAVVKSGVCSESVSDEATITVKPIPAVAAPEDKFYCMGETTLAIPLTSSPEGAIFDITGGASIGLGDKTGVIQVPPFTAIPGNAVVQITPRLNGCTGETVTYNVTVNPRPNINLSQSTETIGSGGSTTVSFTSSTPDVTFSWEVFSIDGAITGTSAGNGDELNQTLFNNSATTGSVTYQITATSPFCEGATINYTVYIHPEISATISGENEVCENSSSPDITFTANGGTEPYTFTYTVNGGANQTITTISGNSVTLAVPTDTPDTYTYNLISAAGSSGWEYPQTGTATVIVKPLPELTSTLTPTGICSNTAFNYTPSNSIGGTVFSWTREVIPGISNPASSGTDDIDETLINTTSSPVEVTYTYTLTANGCSNTQEVKIMVTQSPELTSSTSINDICSGSLLEYTPTSSINPGTTFSWYRDADSYGNSANSGSGNISETLYNNSENPITVYYHYTLSSNGCVNPTDFLVEVTVVPAPEVSASASEYTICPNTSINLFSNSNISSSLPATILTQDFNGSLGSWTRDPNNNYNGSWIPSSSYYNGWTNITNGGSQFYISDMRNANSTSTLISPAINTQGYTSVSLSFLHYYREGGYSDRARVQWSRDGNNWNDLISYSSSEGQPWNFTEETISLPVGEPSVYIQFYFDARYDYYWAIDDVEITGVAQSAADILWTSNTSSWTSTEANPTNVIPTETTTYTATYTDPDTGCSGSASTTVTVYPQPTPTIHADYCVVSPKIRLTATSGYNSYTWQPLPYGETDGNNHVDIDIAGIYTVNVVDANGCTGAASINVSNEYVTNGSFEMGNTGFTTPAAINGNQYQYVADNPSSTTELWPEGLYGIGDNAQNYHSNFWGVDHTTGTGNFMIVNGFPGAPQPIVWQQTITNLQPNTDYYFSAWAISLNDVGNDAQLRFSINGNQLGTVADLTAIHGASDNSNPWLDEGRFWGVWNSGNSTSAVLAIVDLQTAPNGNDFGLDDISFGILDPSPAEIDPSSGGDVCAGGTIELFANVSGGKEPITYSWVGPNGHTSNDENPVFVDVDGTYDGTYTLTVTDWYGCDIPSKTVDVKVYPQAVVDAGDDQTNGCSANTAFQLNGSISGAAQSATWLTSGTGNFDDATKLDAIYTYSAEDIVAGTVTLTLTTDDPDGPCPAASDQIEITIYPSPELDVTVQNPLCYGYSTGSALASASNGTPDYTYSWSNGQTTAEATGLTVGSYKVTVTDSKGCYDTLTINVVEPEPLVVYPPSFTPPTCYGGNDGTATINVEGGTLPYVFTWDAATGNQTTQTATGLSVGTYLFTVTDANGCNITSDFVLVTQPDPPTLTCPPDPDPVYAAIGETTAPVTLEDPIYDPTCQTISWTMDGATVVSTPVDGIVPSPYTFNAGITTVTYTTVNTAGEKLECSFDVEVIPNDPPDITCIDPEPVSATTDLCSAEINIDLPTINAGSNISWEWEMTGATEDSGTDEITPNPYTFKVGITTITWTATNLAGTDICTQTITVTDDQNPTFTSSPMENCVDKLYSVVYAPSSPNPNSGTDPNLIKNPSPDYYTFKAGDTSLDIADLADNCCAPEDMTIHWQINFTDTPDPLNATGTMLTHAPINGTGQPSTYGSDILFPGDGINFTEVTHTITFWIEDCNGNRSDDQVQNIVITPRPQIIKQN